MGCLLIITVILPSPNLLGFTLVSCCFKYVQIMEYVGQPPVNMFKLGS